MVAFFKAVLKAWIKNQYCVTSIYDQHKFKKLEILLKILFRPLGKILATRGLETNNFSRETKTVLVGFILVIMKNISEAQKFRNGCCRVQLNH